MKLKGYYLFSPEEKEHAHISSGVYRKVHAQSEIFSKVFDFTLFDLPVIIYSDSFFEKIKRRLPYTAAWRKWKYSGEFDDADFLYIRQVYHDQSFVRYLKKIKESNPKITVIYEIPTYPFEIEGNISLFSKPFIIKEKNGQKGITKYIDRIVTFYGQKEIWGVPCIDLINGYDFSKVELPKREIPDSVEIISVSNTAFWHGYDRLIEGLNNYYKNGGKENIVYHLIGNIIPQHKELIEKYNLNNHVILHDRMSGEPLNEMYKKCLIGVDILGGHRKDYPVSSTLKSREYAAWGLPVITSSPVDYLPKDYKYQFLAPYDESPIDIEKLLEFYHNIYDNSSCDDVANEIREYAISKCDMSVTMMPVVEWLKSE